MNQPGGTPFDRLIWNNDYKGTNNPSNNDATWTEWMKKNIFGIIIFAIVLVVIAVIIYFVVRSWNKEKDTVQQINSNKTHLTEIAILD